MTDPAKRAAMVAHTQANKARRQTRHEARIQKRRDKYREGMPLKEWRAHRGQARVR